MAAHAKPAPDVTYWACPHGCIRIALKGEALRAALPVLDLLGVEIYETFLTMIAPQQWLEDAEAAVERHEAHHGIVQVVAP